MLDVVCLSFYWSCLAFTLVPTTGKGLSTKCSFATDRSKAGNTKFWCLTCSCDVLFVNVATLVGHAVRDFVFVCRKVNGSAFFNRRFLSCLFLSCFSLLARSFCHCALGCALALLPFQYVLLSD